MSTFVKWNVWKCKDSPTAQASARSYIGVVVLSHDGMHLGPYQDVIVLLNPPPINSLVNFLCRWMLCAMEQKSCCQVCWGMRMELSWTRKLWLWQPKEKLLHWVGKPERYFSVTISSASLIPFAPLNLITFILLGPSTDCFPVGL